MIVTYETERFDDEGPGTHKPADNKPPEDSLNFGDTTVAGVHGIGGDEYACCSCE